MTNKKLIYVKLSEEECENNLYLNYLTVQLKIEILNFIYLNLLSSLCAEYK